MNEWMDGCSIDGLNSTSIVLVVTVVDARSEMWYVMMALFSPYRWQRLSSSWLCVTVSWQWGLLDP